MSLEKALRDKLAAFAMGEIAAEDLLDWVDDAEWDMPHGSEPEASRLANQILAVFAERDARAIDRAELHRQLVGLLNNIQVQLSAPSALSSSSVVPWSSLALQLPA